MASQCDENSLLGDKTYIRKTLVRHIVASIMADISDGRSFEDLDILELGAGAGFFALSYAEVYGGSLANLVQTDADPQRAEVLALDVSELSSLPPDDLAARLGGRRDFDVVLSVDFLSCLAFGAGLDSEDPDDADALSQLDEGLCRVLRCRHVGLQAGRIGLQAGLDA